MLLRICKGTRFRLRLPNVLAQRCLRAKSRLRSGDYPLQQRPHVLVLFAQAQLESGGLGRAWGLDGVSGCTCRLSCRRGRGVRRGELHLYRALCPSKARGGFRPSQRIVDLIGLELNLVPKLVSIIMHCGLVVRRGVQLQGCHRWRRRFDGGRGRHPR